MPELRDEGLAAGRKEGVTGGPNIPPEHTHKLFFISSESPAFSEA